MAATDEPLTVEMAAERLLIPQVEEAEENPETEQAESDDAPVEAEQTDADDVEAEEEDDADAEGEDETGQDDDDPDDEAEEQPADIHTVTVDGEEREVTLEELKRGYAGQAYIQKGMRETADQKKQIESVYAQLQQEREHVSQLWNQLQQGQVSAPPQPPTRDLLESDPIGYMEARAEYEERLAEYSQQQQQFQQIQHQQTEAQQRAHKQFLEEEKAALVQAIPELGDAKAAPKVREGIMKAGEFYGFTAEELGQIVDHRAIKVLNDARKFRELQEGKQTVAEKASKARPTVKSKAKNGPSRATRQRLDARKRLKETGSVDDAVALILEMPERT